MRQGALGGSGHSAPPPKNNFGPKFCLHLFLVNSRKVGQAWGARGGGKGALWPHPPVKNFWDQNIFCKFFLQILLLNDMKVGRQG